MIRMVTATQKITAMICQIFIAIGVLHICYHMPFQVQMDMSPFWTAQNVDALLVKMMLLQWTNEPGLGKKPKYLIQMYYTKIWNFDNKFFHVFLYIKLDLLFLI